VPRLTIYDGAHYFCKEREQPVDLESTIAINTSCVQSYNYEQPNQTVTCGNELPLVQFPHAPNLTLVPQMVDPHCWTLLQMTRVHTRKPGRDGCIQSGNYTCYVPKKTM
jgi:hypothetical protein